MCVLEQRQDASLIHYLTNYVANTCLTRHLYVISAPQVRFLGMLSLAPFSVPEITMLARLSFPLKALGEFLQPILFSYLFIYLFIKSSPLWL